jgi:hypothetical protein
MVLMIRYRLLNRFHEGRFVFIEQKPTQIQHRPMVSERLAVKDWCVEEMPERFTWHPPYVHVYDEAMAVAFKLRWC